MKFTREYLEANLNNLDDPYGLADTPEPLLKYLAPKQIGEVERFELARRERSKKNGFCPSGTPKACNPLVGKPE